ncbi:hypothetical protein PIB30_001494 [Stylosanthes scabra]|uniref:Secreted protein n=1 Tax=Stylosanthes scabra TaxID=79078 RepID=A0ABU6Q2J4_9FABA|nr:hypothetical protein [Stylosanthes scabra]
MLMMKAIFVALLLLVSLIFVPSKSTLEARVLLVQTPHSVAVAGGTVVKIAAADGGRGGIAPPPPPTLALSPAPAKEDQRALTPTAVVASLND